MFYKIKNTFFILIIFLFIFSVVKYYFSEESIKFINKSRSTYLTSIVNNTNNLPLLENNTNDAITYISDLENYKKKRKIRIWERIISDGDQ